MRESAAARIRDGARSLGTQFAAARQKRGLTIEKVASETHIRVQRLREIERDDFSRFAHPSYARMFAIDYAKYLGIPISRVRRLLPDAGECGTEGYQYLRESACDYMRTTVRPFRRQRRLVRKLATTAVLILLGLGSVKVWTTIRDIERLGLNRMAREDNAILAVPNIQQANPGTTVTPGSPADSSDVPTEESEIPASEVPVGHSVPAGEAALLVGADVGQDSRVR
jgi:cytoskeletal protein RodZ